MNNRYKKGDRFRQIVDKIGRLDVSVLASNYPYPKKIPMKTKIKQVAGMIGGFAVFFVAIPFVIAFAAANEIVSKKKKEVY